MTVGGLLGWFATFALEPSPDGLLPLVDLVLGAGAIVLVRWRRRWPVAVAVLCTAATVVSAVAVPVALLAVVSLVSSRGWRPAAAVALLGALASAPYAWLRPVAEDDLVWWGVMLATLGIYGVAVVIGLYLRARRELAQSKRDVVATAEREQAARLDQARANERSRIAREMHDVLAHRISLVAMHAGAMTYRTDLGREELLSSARVVQENAHQALIDLREVLGVLRQTTDPGAPPVAPQPVLADLPRLVEETEAVGTPVRLVTPGLDLATVPDLVGRTAYRIVQEGLTNARKHAADCPVEVRLSGSPGDRLEIRLSNPVPVGAVLDSVPGAGVGLIGLGERVGLVGGGLSHGETPYGDFVVRAWLPWPR